MVEVKATEPAANGASAMVEDAAAEPPAVAEATPDESKVRHSMVSSEGMMAQCAVNVIKFYRSAVFPPPLPYKYCSLLLQEL